MILAQAGLGAIGGGVVVGGGFLFMLAMMALAALVFRGRRSYTADGDVVMQYGLGYRIMAAFVLVCGVGSVVGTVLMVANVIPYDALGLWILYGAAVLFTLIGFAGVLEAFLRNVVIYDDGLGGRGVFGSVGLMRWEDIESVTYHRLIGGFVVKAGRQSLWVIDFLGGRKEFIRICKKNLDKEVYGNVFKKYGKMPFEFGG
jgi:hypothetical protein